MTSFESMPDRDLSESDSAPAGCSTSGDAPAPAAPLASPSALREDADATVAARPRLITFFDGQNLYNSARELYGYADPTFDPQLLSELVSVRLGYELVEVRFYTGVHEQSERPRLFALWTAKLRRMANRGVTTVKRTLAYTRESVSSPDGTTRTVSVGREKGIDLRLGLDMVRLARERAFDAVVLFSADNDLGEATDEVKRIAREQGRFVHVHSAFPCGKDAGHRGHRGKRGVERTNWVRLTRKEYDACLEVVPSIEAGGPGRPGGAGSIPAPRAPRAGVVQTGLGPTAAAAASSAPQPTAFGVALLAAVEAASGSGSDTQSGAPPKAPP